MIVAALSALIKSVLVLRSLAHNNFTTVNSSITFASLELLYGTINVDRLDPRHYTNALLRSLTANNLVSIEATLPSLQEL